MPLLSRPQDSVRVRSSSPLATPAPKSQIPTIRLVAATPSEANTTRNPIADSSVAPWEAGPSPTPLAPKAGADAPRKRLVPKKSKLGLLGSTKERGQDLSDVVRRVGASASTGNNGSFEIYVDPTNDPEIGEILMVKKKKSRAALDGMRWGTLGEVTNVPAVTKKEKDGKKESSKENGKDGLLKVKVDEKEKWWSIGRGRKDSKEKERSKSPEPTLKPIESRARFNSLDSGILLNSPVFPEHPASPVEHLRVPTPTSASPSINGMLAPPGAVGNGKGSVAIRAMRSVRSLARIGSWAQLRNTSNPEDADEPAPEPTKSKEKSEPKKKKKKKDKEREKEKEKNETVRYSGSSFEAGALSASPGASTEKAKTLGRKKASILGLGLPSTMRLPSVRNGSTASSVVMQQSNRLSVDSATILGGGILARGRSGSTISTASSLRPKSMSSSVSGASSGSSVRWDEAGLATVKECRKKERESKEKESKGSTKKDKKSKKSKDKESRKTSDSRKRTPLAAIFSDSQLPEEEQSPKPGPGAPIVTIEEATADGHSLPDDDVPDRSMETPVKRARPRPVSEQLLGRSRPKAIYEDDDDNAVMSLLDAATNDLAQLINRLDLEATPGTPDMTPVGRSPFSLEKLNETSPTKNRLTMESPMKGLRGSMTSVSSLRPYAQSWAKASSPSTAQNLIGQNIAPWTTLNASISPSKSPVTARVPAKGGAPTLRLTHKRTMSPAPAADASPVFKALRPAKSNYPVTATKIVGASPMGTPLGLMAGVGEKSPSSLTFGSAHSKSDSHDSLSASPVFKKAHGHVRKRSSLVPAEYLKQQHDDGYDSPSLPIPPEARRNLGLAGTMGGSVGSDVAMELDASDPDSDIPDELQVILQQSDDGSLHEVDVYVFLSQARTPALAIARPSTRIALAAAVRSRTAGMSSEDDTKKSFDFTGELQKLNESGGSDRRSFVEQLENAFRTPAKIDLRYDFGMQLHNGFLSGDVPPVPKLPSLQDELTKAREHTYDQYVEFSAQDFPVDVNAEPSLLPGTDSFASSNQTDDDILAVESRKALKNTSSMGSRPSDGQLNRDFKFGGRPSPARSAEEPKAEMPMTLSDIIPPPSVVHSLSEASLEVDESALLKSIFANAVEIPSPPARVRLDSDSSSKRMARDVARNSVINGHYRHSSGLSFAGFDSFAEVRRGFEFNDSRPGFYPPPGASHSQHGRHESVFSIASVSSYGHVINSGSSDPFDYAAAAHLPACAKDPLPTSTPAPETASRQ
ncbi:hypothetical protein BV22DRAFT_1133018 [Leucogyrophana mollusca]|uniref:Uncharacterized protein n=1 Tax=Leucogyrophana mollusca TaxID=85980 RepID=A0ACB8B546_9AGAM|nr:hypothetical protein BV22DRAFT_1133018 [Leucogyrophana mollusca]